MTSKNIADYAAMQREYYNARATGLDEARRLVHPDFTYASGQAPGFVRFLLQQYAATRSGSPSRPEGPPARATDPSHPSETTPPSTRERPARRVSRFRERAVRRGSDLILKGTSRILGLLQPGLSVVAWSASASTIPDSRLPDALDFGCGVGRIMRAHTVLGGRVDGVDISREMLSYAKSDPVLAGSAFFESSGTDCGRAPSSSYDIVYSAICMQHIASRAVRLSILKDMRRVLRNGGMVAIQFHYYPNLRDKDVPRPHVSWTADAFDAQGTNSEADVWITPDSVATVLEDFRQHFSDPTLFFCAFPQDAKLFQGPYGEYRFEHVIVTATAGLTRADAIYGLEAP